MEKKDRQRSRGRSGAGEPVGSRPRRTISRNLHGDEEQRRPSVGKRSPVKKAAPEPRKPTPISAGSHTSPRKTAHSQFPAPRNKRNTRPVDKGARSRHGASRPRQGARNGQRRVTPQHVYRGLTPIQVKLGAILLSLIMCICVIAFVTNFALDKIAEHQQNVAEKPVHEAQPVACTPRTLSASLHQGATTATGGTTFTLKMHNNSRENPCYVNLGWANADLRISSGPTQVFSSATCHIGPENKRLLLDRDMSAETSFAWSGLVTTGAQGCAGADKAGPGSYTVQLTVKDGALPQLQLGMERH